MITHNKHYIWAKLWHFKFIKTHRKDSSFLSILCVTLRFRIWKYTKLLSADWLNWNPVGTKTHQPNAHTCCSKIVKNQSKGLTINREISVKNSHQKHYEICCLLCHFRFHLFISMLKTAWWPFQFCGFLRHYQRLQGVHGQ